MKLFIALSLFSALAQVGFAGKCRIKPAFSVAEPSSSAAESPFSAAETVYITVPEPTESSISEPSPTYIASSDTDTPVPAETTSISDKPTPVKTTTSSETPTPAEMTTSTEKTIHATSSSSSHASTSPSPSPEANYYQITLGDLNDAVPKRAGVDSCSAVTYASECAINSRAVTAINKALTKYKITRRGEAVAIISIMGYKSDSWQYNINHSPGTPGQGTRNMQNYTIISEYAKELHPADTAKALGTGAVTDQVMNNVRALVLNDDDSFGSGFWYLVNHAPNYYNNADKLRSGYPADFRDYVVNSDGYGSVWADDYFGLWLTLNAYLPK